MKRLINIFIFAFLSMSISAFAAEGEDDGKEWVKVGEYFTNINGHNVYGESTICNKIVELERMRTDPWHLDIKWTGVTTGFEYGNSPFIACFVTDSYYEYLSFAVLCEKGSFHVNRPRGCYEYKEHPCASKPATFGDSNSSFISEFLKSGTVCYQGCLYASDHFNTTNGGLPFYLYGPFSKVGNTECKAAETEPGGEEQPEPEETDCEAGTCPGTINGTKVCVPCDPGGEEGEGSGEGEEGEGSGEGGEGEGGTGTGEGEGGGTGEGGTGTGEGEGEEEEGKESSWSGSCKGGYNGEGDALVVAIAKAEYERNCSMIDDLRDSSEYTLYNKTKEQNKYDDSFGSATKDLPSTDINLRSYIKDSNLLGSCSGLSDTTFSAFGHTITIPISKVNDNLAWLGYMVQAIAYLIALRICFG